MVTAAGAASSAVRDLLDGPGRTGTVRHIGRSSLTVGVAGRVLVLDASAGPGTLPCAVVVPALDRRAAGGLGAPALVGCAAVRLSGAVVRVVRWWQPPRVQPGHALDPALAIDVVAVDAQVLDAEVLDCVTAAARYLALGRADAAADHLCAVLGRGPGSTPAADDAVAGVLLGARRAMTGRTEVVETAGATVVAAAADRTTPLSSELLRHSARGLATAVTVRAVHHPRGPSWAALLEVGGTSGTATAAGIRVVFQVLAGAGAGPAVERRAAA